MINADNIGKRIRMLRKQKHVSQERMAEDLGMYQADISNLERAIGGSGITDLFKLDMIADYFGITLVELLNGYPESSVEAASENQKSEGYELKDYTISNIKYGSIDDIFASELTLVAPDKETIIVSFSEYDESPRFYRSGSSCYEKLLSDRGDPKREKELNQNCFLSGEDYIDIFNKVDPKWVSICRYLIFIATEDENTVETLVEKTEGKSLAEIEVPVPSREPEDLFYVNYSDLSVVYRYRLMVETSLKNPHVYDEIENTTKREKAILEKLKAACASEEAYKAWKKDLIDAKMKEVMEKQHIIVCEYMFFGMGTYKEMIPEEMLESFKCWIDGNGSAVFLGSHDASRREIRTYVSHHIADELLGIEF